MPHNPVDGSSLGSTLACCKSRIVYPEVIAKGLWLRVCVFDLEHCRRKAIHTGSTQSVVGRPMPEDSRAPNHGAGGLRCNAEVWQWSVGKKDLQFGSFAGLRRACMGNVSRGSELLVPLNAIQTKLPPVLLSL